MSPVQGDRFGPWTLEAKCGSGGNAVVWEATSADGARAALKLINAVSAGKEPYRRFVTEIETLRTIGTYAGVVPVLDTYLPVDVAAGDRPWLAMRLAEPIGRALETADLVTIVAAVQSVADTLARLRDDHGLAHRDIKPANLYRLEDSWCIGDFGLVALPDRDGLTQVGKPLGPAHYVPDEMLLNPAGADPFAADVYSLAKTLWVLATRQNFPPQGHQPSAALGNGIADFNQHAHATALDRLVDRMTVRDPTGRPPMRQVAEELATWLKLSNEPPLVNVAAPRQRLLDALADELAELDMSAQNREFARAAVRQYNAACAPINQALRDLHPSARLDQTTDRDVDSLLQTDQHWGSPEIVWRWARLSSIAIGPEHYQYSLRLGRGLELAADGNLILHAFIDVGRPGLGARDYDWTPASRSTRVGTIEADAMIQDVVRELAEALEVAASTLADHAETMRAQAAD